MSNWIRKQGTAIQSGAGTTAIIAAPGSTRRLYVKTIIIGISTHQDTATFLITDGTTSIIPITLCKDGNGSAICYNFPGEGFECAKNSAISITVATAAAVVGVTVYAEEH